VLSFCYETAVSRTSRLGGFKKISGEKSFKPRFKKRDCPQGGLTEKGRLRGASGISILSDEIGRTQVGWDVWPNRG